jgi:RNA polymerase sigma factor (sigma-70 family)
MIFQKFKKNGQLHIADDVASIEIEEDLYSEDDVDLQVRLLQNGLDKLGEQCKKVLQLFYYEEKKLDEIQEQLGYTSKDVLKSQKSRCLKQLKELIKA